MNIKQNKFFMVELPIFLQIIITIYVSYLARGYPLLVFVCGCLFGIKIIRLVEVIEEEKNK